VNRPTVSDKVVMHLLAYLSIGAKMVRGGRRLLRENLAELTNPFTNKRRFSIKFTRSASAVTHSEKG